MPKETQALERLKSTLLAEGYWQDALEDINIIENALNEYYRLLKEDDETTKKLKALEIIKEKGIILQFIKETYTVEQYNAGVFGTLVKPLTKEDYDLLKEMLL